MLNNRTMEEPMKATNKRFLVTGALSSLLVLACVTINIYFPAEKVESVAGEIVNEIRGKEKVPEEQNSDKDRSSLLEKTIRVVSLPVAYAAEVTDVSNPTIRSLKQSMKNRYSSLKPYYLKGLIKEESDGFISIKSESGLDLKSKRTLRTLIEAENNDRKKLYAEIASALKIEQSQIAKIGAIFAKEWQKPVR